MPDALRYSELTRRYFEQPVAAGTLNGPGVYSGEAGSKELGTWVRFSVRAGSGMGGGPLQEARFLAFGCPHVIAVASYVAAQATGREPPWVLPEAIVALSERFAVPVEKRGRLLIIEDAWLAALRNIPAAPMSA